jgi:pyruvate formate lyase activating enzyme
MTTVADILDELTRDGELYETLKDNSVRCYACGHRCLIREGKRGICQVRFNEGGKLRVPWGYVAALQSDPVEKKPFFHVLPGSNALTFGMLGCDFHCGYCFIGDTMVVTNRGPIALQEVFNLGTPLQKQPDGEISIPFDLKAITSSGKLHKIKAVFRHPYEGEMIKIKPYYLPSITCTPDHRVYATEDQNTEPYMVQAKDLTNHHYLVVPRRFHLPSLPIVDAMEYIDAYKPARDIPWMIWPKERVIARLPAETKPNRNATFMSPYHASDMNVALQEKSSREPWFSKSNTITRYGNSDVDRKIIEIEEFYLIPIREIARESFKGHVFNLEVDEEHNYLANFLLVSNCQNWLTSQAMRDPHSDVSVNYVRHVTPEKMVQFAHDTDASIVVSSYNEPLITSEWAVAIFKEAKAAGLMCAYVSNGNNTPEVMEYLRPYISAYKVDLKCMQDKNYRKLGGVLQNTLDGIQRARAMGLWVEVVTLIVPGFNDSNEELWDAARFLASLSPDIPWHVTAFHKDYKMTEPDNTPAQTLLRASEIGREAGLRYVYAGNLPGRVVEYENTFCPNCNQIVVGRTGYVITEYHLTGEGKCPNCGTRVPGIWPEKPGQVKLNGWGMPRSV